MGHADLKLIPSGKRQFRVLAQADFNESANLSIEGDWFVDARRWSMKGQLKGIQKSGELLEVAAGTSPVLRQKLVEFNADLERTRIALTDPGDTPTEALDQFQPSPRIPNESHSPIRDLPDFGFESNLDLNFQVTQTAPGKEWQFQFLMDLEQGTITHPSSCLSRSAAWPGRSIGTIGRWSSENSSPKTAPRGFRWTAFCTEASRVPRAD